MSILIRPSADADLPAMTAIYSHAVRMGTASFELEPPDEAEMRRRHVEVRARGLPWLCAVDASTGDQVAGYAYAAPFRPRPAYHFTVEDSIYVDGHRQGSGIGRLLLAELVTRCAAWGARQMVAVIGGADPGSIALHRRLGFRTIGTLAAVGWKHGAWRDVALMQRALGCGGSPGSPERP